MEPANNRQEKQQAFKVTGMHCASCVNRVEQALKNTPGVIDAVVNLATEKAAITYDPSQITPAALAEKIESLGYAVAMDKLELVITGMHCASCVARVSRHLKMRPGS